MMRICRILVLACVLGPFPLNAAVYYVSPSGNDSSGNGSLSNPWRTIRHGMDRMSGGDTLYLRGGEYVEPAIRTGLKSGSSPSRPTVIASYPGERAVFVSNSDTSTAAFDFQQVCSNVVLDGWTVDGRNYGSVDKMGVGMKINLVNGVLTNMHFINWSHHSALQPVGLYTSPATWSSNVVISSCLFSNIAASAGSGIAIYTWSAHDMVIENNVFTACGDRGVQYGSDATGMGMTNLTIRGNRFLRQGSHMMRLGTYANSAELSNVRIYNNLFIDCSRSDAVRGTTAAINTASRDALVANNTIIQTVSGESYGVYVRQGSADIVNNIIWGDFTYPILVRADRNARMTNNITGPNKNLYGTGSRVVIHQPDYNGSPYDPRFIRWPTDLRVSADSIAVGNGMDLSRVFTVDYSGQVRTTPWDIGAYAHTSGGAATRPLAPVGFRGQ